MTKDEELTDGEPGGQLDVPGAVVCLDQALPHVQQRVGVQSECRYVVNQHDVHAQALPAAVGQDRVHIGCKSHRAGITCLV